MFVMREDDHQRNERRECEYSEYTPRKACSPSWWTSQGRIMIEEMKRCVPTKRTANTPIATIGFICSLSDRRPNANPTAASELSRCRSNALNKVTCSQPEEPFPPCLSGQITVDAWITSFGPTQPS
jgi:hypothetical protein